MRRWFAKFMLVAVVVGLLGSFAATGVMAAANGTGPENALAPSSGEQTLAVGQRVWYAFQSGGDKDEQVQVRLHAIPAGSANFAIWSKGNVETWRQGDEVTPIGMGTVQTVGKDDNRRTLFNGDLLWVANLTEAGPYYIVVDQTGATASRYQLTASGRDISFGAFAPSQANVQMAMATGSAGQAKELPAPMTLPVLGTQASAAAAPQAAPGSGPANALAFPNSAQTLAVGQTRWYSFEHGGRDFQTFIRLSGAPDSASFTVWTPDDLRNLVENNEFAPVGAGTHQTRKNKDGETVDIMNGDLFWSGNFASPGTYYVMVQQRGATPATYRLGVQEVLTAKALAGE